MRFVCGQIRGVQEEYLTNAVAEVQVIDCSMACAPSVTLGSAIIHPQQLPFEYEVHYDDAVFANGVRGRYAVQVSIHIDGRLAFLNDTNFSLIDEATNEILERVNVDVISI